jgi:hypothetical protein
MTWGIIKYAAGSGTFPETDVASFDGWYTDRAEAEAIFAEWDTLPAMDRCACLSARRALG